MFPALFDYQKSSSVQEALSLLSQNSNAKLLAGGQSLLPSMKLRLTSPEKLIDISALDSLKNIGVSGGTIEIGAGCTHATIASSSVVQQHAPCLSQCAGKIGDMMIRNLGTIGGSVAHADPAADYPGVLFALDASVHIAGPSGSRKISAREFFIGFFETSLKENEIIEKISFPSIADWKSCYVKYPNPASRYPIVGCAAAVKVSGGQCADVRVGFSGVAYTAFRDIAVENALKGTAFNAGSIAKAKATAAESCEVLEDATADSEYRKQMAKHFAGIALSSLL